MAPDRRLVDHRQLEVAARMAKASVEYIEQQLGQATLRPPTGKELLRRLGRLRADVDQLASLLAELQAGLDSEQQPGLD